MKKILFTLLLACTATGANATLINSYVNIDLWFASDRYSGDWSVGNMVDFNAKVTTGKELNGGSKPDSIPYSLDIGANGIDVYFHKAISYAAAPSGPNNAGTVIISSFDDSLGQKFSSYSNFSTNSTFSTRGISIGDNLLKFDFSGYSFMADQKIHLDLNFYGASLGSPSNPNPVTPPVSTPVTPPNGNAVPEPATLALLGLGLLGIAARRRKQ